MYKNVVKNGFSILPSQILIGYSLQSLLKYERNKILAELKWQYTFCKIRYQSLSGNGYTDQVRVGI